LITKTMIENIHLGKIEHEMLLKIRRNTGLQNWNVICRWAFCLSLAIDDNPPKIDAKSDSSTEMTWKTFGGDNEGVYCALLDQSTHSNSGNRNDSMRNRVFRDHLRRGLEVASLLTLGALLGGRKAE
jgi:DNA sulfur modification protein DndE